MDEKADIQNILQILKELDKSNSFEIYLPSLQKNVLFKQLNAEQLKNILKSSVDSSLYKKQFTATTNNLIKENILDKDININELNIFDKLLFLIKTRIESISPEYTFYFNDDEISEYSLEQANFTINLSEIYNAFISSKPTYNKIEIENGNCTITVALPNILTENRLEDELYKNIKLQISTTEELQATIGETFINEITKYIYNLKINDQIINLNDLNFNDRIKIVEQLSAPIITQILKYIESYKILVAPLITHSQFNIEKEIAFNTTIFNI